MTRPVAVLRPPGRVNYLSRLELFLDPYEIERTSFAYQCSKYGHAKQVRDDGSRFFDHPKSVAWIYISTSSEGRTRMRLSRTCCMICRKIRSCFPLIGSG